MVEKSWEYQILLHIETVFWFSPYYSRERAFWSNSKEPVSSRSLMYFMKVQAYLQCGAQRFPFELILTVAPMISHFSFVVHRSYIFPLKNPGELK